MEKMKSFFTRRATGNRTTYQSDDESARGTAMARFHGKLNFPVNCARVCECASECVCRCNPSPPQKSRDPFPQIRRITEAQRCAIHKDNESGVCGEGFLSNFNTKAPPSKWAEGEEQNGAAAPVAARKWGHKMNGSKWRFMRWQDLEQIRQSDKVAATLGCRSVRFRCVGARFLMTFFFAGGFSARVQGGKCVPFHSPYSIFVPRRPPLRGIAYLCRLGIELTTIVRRLAGPGNLLDPIGEESGAMGWGKYRDRLGIVPAGQLSPCWTSLENFGPTRGLEQQILFITFEQSLTVLCAVRWSGWAGWCWWARRHDIATA